MSQNLIDVQICCALSALSVTVEILNYFLSCQFVAKPD